MSHEQLLELCAPLPTFEDLRERLGTFLDHEPKSTAAPASAADHVLMTGLERRKNYRAARSLSFNVLNKTRALSRTARVAKDVLRRLATQMQEDNTLRVSDVVYDDNWIGKVHVGMHRKDRVLAMRLVEHLQVLVTARAMAESHSLKTPKVTVADMLRSVGKLDEKGPLARGFEIAAAAKLAEKRAQAHEEQKWDLAQYRDRIADWMWRNFEDVCTRNANPVTLRWNKRREPRKKAKERRKEVIKRREEANRQEEAAKERLLDVLDPGLEETQVLPKSGDEVMVAAPETNTRNVEPTMMHAHNAISEYWDAMMYEAAALPRATHILQPPQHHEVSFDRFPSHTEQPDYYLGPGAAPSWNEAEEERRYRPMSPIHQSSEQIVAHQGLMQALHMHMEEVERTLLNSFQTHSNIDQFYNPAEQPSPYQEPAQAQYEEADMLPTHIPQTHETGFDAFGNSVNGPFSFPMPSQAQHGWVPESYDQEVPAVLESNLDPALFRSEQLVSYGEPAQAQEDEGAEDEGAEEEQQDEDTRSETLRAESPVEVDYDEFYRQRNPPRPDLERERWRIRMPSFGAFQSYQRSFPSHSGSPWNH